jgi:DNA-binding NarL/FixJ family response regulator
MVADARLSKLSRVRVLLVDDTSEVRTRLSGLLRELHGIEADEAGSSEEALERLERSPADVVVVDIHMGEKNGLDLITEVTLKFPRALVIVLTNDTNHALWREALRRGASFFFDKSRDFERAVDAVVHCLVIAGGRKNEST